MLQDRFLTEIIKFIATISESSIKFYRFMFWNFVCCEPIRLNYGLNYIPGDLTH
jgi:hypothetical protein